MDKSLRGLQFVSLALILIGIGVIVHGLKVRAFESHPAIIATHRYFDAIKTGSQPKLLAELSPDAQINWILAHPQPLEPTPSFQLRIKQTKLKESSAIVTVELQEDRYKIQPSLSIRKQSDGSWKIHEVLNIEPGVELAREIERARIAERKSIESQLKTQIVESPGVEVRR